MVGGYPRFQYGGFSFSVVDPWPEYWSDDWYDNDDMYIDNTGDGYYLYNRRYPQDRDRPKRVLELKAHGVDRNQNFTVASQISSCP